MLNLSRRQFFISSMAVSAGALLAACGGTAAAPSPSSASARPSFAGATLRTQMPPLLHAAPFFLANDLGFFKDQGLDVQMDVSNAQIDTMVQLLTGAKLDCFTGNTDASLNNALTRGAPIKALAVGEVGKQGYHYTGLVISDKLWQEGVHKPEDLRQGGQIAVEMNVAMGLNNTSGRKYYEFMQFHGFQDPIKDFKIKEWTNPAPIIQGFEAGQMDALFTGEPRVATVVEQSKAHVLGWDTDALAIQGEPAILVTVNEGWLRQDSERGVRFMMGYLKGVQTYMDLLASGWKDPKLRKIVADRAQVKEALFDHMGGPYFPADGLVDLARIDKAVSFFKTTIPDIKGDVVPASKYVDFSYVKEAASRLGVKASA